MNKNNPIVVFNLVDSASNEESLAYLSSGLLEYMRIPYTGCTLDNLYITTNKVLTKQLLKEASIPTPWWFYRDENKTLLEESVTRFIIKPIKEDASIGLDEYSVVPSQKVIEILHEKKDHFAEAFIEGREFTVCMFGTTEHCTILTPYEWIFSGYEENNIEKLSHMMQMG